MPGVASVIGASSVGGASVGVRGNSGKLTAPRKADLAHGISSEVQYSVVEKRWKIYAKNTSATKPISLGVLIGSVTSGTISGDEPWWLAYCLQL
jgi:hypothetical protein